ncbi:hypothetical protein ACOSQ4_026282 [Xanthoceras sorbifolium]
MWLREQILSDPDPLPLLLKKNRGVAAEVQNEISSRSKPAKAEAKAKTTKAERRALQEGQRAAKVAAKAEGNKAAAASGRATSGKPTKQPSQKKDNPAVTPSVVGTDRKAGDLSRSF